MTIEAGGLDPIGSAQDVRPFPIVFERLMP